MDKYEQLERFAKLKDSGVLSEEEFTAQKKRILADTQVSVLDIAASTSPPSGVTPKADFLLKPVIRDVIIIWILTFIGGFIVGIINGLFDGFSIVSTIAAATNVLLSIVGFAISGCLAPPRRWRHLIFVAVGVWVTSFINVVLGDSLSHWFLGGLVMVVISMPVGGALSYVFKRDSQLSVTI